MMKLAVLLFGLAGVSAFAPSSNNVQSTALKAVEMESLRGANSPETGGKMVSLEGMPSGRLFFGRLDAGRMALE